MGKKSLNKHNSVFLEARQELGLSRESASELLEIISEDRLEKIENKRAQIHPDEVLLISKKYKKPSLCNHYCSHECPIGQTYIPFLEPSDLNKMTMELLVQLDIINKNKERMMEVAVDGEITEDEKGDYAMIKKNLDEIAKTIHSINMWIKEKNIQLDI